MKQRKSRTLRFRRRTTPGAPPGIVRVDPGAQRPTVNVMAFNDKTLKEQRDVSIDQLRDILHHYPVTWVNVEGLGDAEIIQSLGKLFGLHPLALEDVVNVHQRSKVEDYGDNLFIVARMAEYNGRFDSEQVSLFLGKNFVLTFLEDPGDCFGTVRARLRSPTSRLRTATASYLAYSLLDSLIDGYFPVIEKFGEHLDELEGDVLARPTRSAMARSHAVKQELRVIRRAIWPHREMLHALGRETTELVDAETRVYLRDCYDHVVQIIDLVEVYREMCSDLTDLYLSSAGARMNEIMKVLTIISTIFIPLTFIVGVYGMNFDNMPELRTQNGYYVVWAIMTSISAAMLAVFFWKGWFSPSMMKVEEKEEEKDEGGRMKDE